jgi:hypothetical protein
MLQSAGVGCCFIRHGHVYLAYHYERLQQLRIVFSTIADMHLAILHPSEEQNVY